MPQVTRILTCVGLLWLLLLVAFAACNESTGGQAGPGTVDTPLAESLAMPFEGELSINAVNSESSLPMDANRDVIAGKSPCIGASDASCAPRDVSRFGLIPMNPVGAAYTDGLSVPSIEDVLEKGLGLREESPNTHSCTRDDRWQCNAL